MKIFVTLTFEVPEDFLNKKHGNALEREIEGEVQKLVDRFNDYCVPVEENITFTNIKLV